MEEELSLAPQGEERLTVLPNGMLLKHGTSLQLMSHASELINKDFKSDPTKDWEKYEKKQQRLYYATVEDPTNNDEVVCAIRTVLEEEATDGMSRCIIDYIHTKEGRGGQGLAKALVNFIIKLAQSFCMDTYVVSTEDAAAFWMKFGFVLEMDPKLREQYNVFSDTHLLGLPTNSKGKRDSNAKLGEVSAQMDVEDEEEEEEDEEEEDPEELTDIERAILASTQSAATTNAQQPQVVEEDDDDDDLALALAMSMQQQ
eukprot:TRINITY_DN64594_c0_g2_i1.p1 TRINITY_DN64594_c0_g2~~TRINITY_DN64594_c0_g2_i1.p1  ORF type:complete len:275 (-),score=55.81 TRINITY_DN64594_c0_g2_i1:54-824(-)